MVWFVLITVAVVVVAALAVRLKSQEQHSESNPYCKSPVLFSPAERSFLGVLEQVVGEDYRVFGKVRVADVVNVKSLPNRNAWQRAFNRISAKHFDFVLCSRGDLSVVAAVELDDQSHQQPKRRERDGFLAGVCQAIALPLVQVPAQPAYSVHDLRAQVLVALGVQQEPAFEPLAPVSEASEMVPAPPESKTSAPVDAAASLVSDVPVCPKCFSPMVLRQAKTGANAGQEFWGCSAFPQCRCILPAGGRAEEEQSIEEKREDD